MAKNVDTSLNRLSVTGLSDMVRLCATVDQPLLVYGKPGIGKSEIIAATLESMGYAVLDRRASQMLPEDLGGIPLGDTENKRTIRCMPDIAAEAWALHEATQKPVACFFDEINLGSHGVLSGLYEFIHDRKAGGFALPPGTLPVAAANPAGSGAVVTDLPRPLCNRMAIVTYTGPTFDEWTDHAVQREIHPSVLTALKVAPEFLHEKCDPEDERTPTPRAWMKVSTAITELERQPDIPKSFRLAIMAALVGDEAAMKVESIIELHSKLYSFKEIVKAPDTIAPHANLTLAFLQAMMLAGKVSNVDENKAAFAWVERCHPEVLGVFTKRIMARVQRDPACQHIAADAAFLTRIQKMGIVISAGGYLKAA